MPLRQESQILMVILEDKDQNSNESFHRKCMKNLEWELDVLAFDVLSLYDFFKFISTEVKFRSFIDPDFVFPRT